MRKLIIVRGAPGSGKSTYAWDRMMDYRDEDISSAMFEANQFMIDEKGLYKFDPLRLKECHNLCQQGVCKAMIANTKVIYVSNTFIRKWEAAAYYTLAEMWGYEVKVIRCDDQYENDHGVSDYRVNMMRSNMEPYDNEIVKALGA